MTQTTTDPLAAVGSVEAFAESTAFARCLFPDSGRSMSFTELLGIDGLDKVTGATSLRDQWRQHLELCRHAASLSLVPIVGVAGTLNSGKSTVVASMLSEEQRARVLIGIYKEQATHRFVFWLPASWRESGADQLVKTMIEQRCGCEPELLAEAPDQAAEQYNARHSRTDEFGIPLIAFDPGLDTAGLAFLDCPDIQRSFDETSRKRTREVRQQKLRLMAPLCSAFVVVASMQQAESEDTELIFETIAPETFQGQLHFVLNMTQTGDPTTYHDVSTGVIERCRLSGRVSRTYFAQHIPNSEPTLRVQPDFRSTDGSNISLSALQDELDPAELQRDQLKSSVDSLEGFLENVQAALESEIQKGLHTTRALQKKVCAFLASKFLTERGELGTVCFNEAARQLGESIERTAPLSFKVATAPKRACKAALSGIKHAGRWVKSVISPLPSLREATEQDVRQRIQVKDDEFANFILGHEALPVDASRKALLETWKRALGAVVDASASGSYDLGDIDEESRQLWRELPWTKRWLVYTNSMMFLAGAAVAVVLFPFDGGVGLTVWTKYHLVVSGTEVLIGVVGSQVAALLVSLPAAGRLIKQLENKVALPQVSQLYEGLMDGLGLPRLIDTPPKLRRSRGKTIQLADQHSPRLPTILDCLGQPLLRLETQSFEDLKAQVRGITS